MYLACVRNPDGRCAAQRSHERLHIGLHTLDALREGRLVQLSDVAVPYDPPQNFYFVYPPGLRDWPPLTALRTWLVEEVEQSKNALAELGIL